MIKIEKGGLYIETMERYIKRQFNAKNIAIGLFFALYLRGILGVGVFTLMTLALTIAMLLAESPYYLLPLIVCITQPLPIIIRLYYRVYTGNEP